MEIVFTNMDIWEDGQDFFPRSGRLSECLFVHK